MLLDTMTVMIFFVCFFHSESGTFLGLGTVTGSVAVYVTFSLQVKNITSKYLSSLNNSASYWVNLSFFFNVQRLYYVHESHGIVVTDLAFLPDRLSGKNIKGNHETAMLSVAVDSRCQVHTVRNRSKLRFTFE